MKLTLWVVAIAFGYLAWTASTLHVLNQAIGWGIASVACVLIAVSRKPGKAAKKKKVSAGR